MKIEILEEGKKESSEVTFTSCCGAGPANFLPTPSEPNNS